MLITKNKLRAWIICLSAGLFFIYEFAQIDLLNSINEPLRIFFALSGKQIGMLSVYYNLATIIMLIPVGLMVDRYPLRKIICVAMSISVVGTLLFSLATSLIMAEISRFVSGVGGAFAFVSCIKLASRWFPSEKMSLITGIYVSMAMFGGILAQTPIVFLEQQITWRYTIFLFACCGIGIIILNYLIIREPAHIKKNISNNNKISIYNSITASIKNIQNWLCGLYTSLLNLPIVLLGSLWGNIYLVKTNQLTNIQAGNIIIFMFIGIIIGSPSIGFLSDKIKQRKLPMALSALLSLIAITSILISHNQPEYIYMILFFALGLFSSGQIIGYPTIAESNPPAYNGTALGLGSLIVMSGSVTRIIFGKILDLEATHYTHNHIPIYFAQDFRYAMLLLPIAFIIAFLLTLLIQETHCKKILI